MGEWNCNRPLKFKPKEARKASEKPRGAVDATPSLKAGSSTSNPSQSTSGNHSEHAVASDNATAVIMDVNDDDQS